MGNLMGTFCVLLTLGVAEDIKLKRVLVGETFDVKVGQTVFVDNDGKNLLSITFVGVVSDSRCPRGGTSVWQGEVEACFVIRDPDRNLRQAILLVNYGEDEKGRRTQHPQGEASLFKDFDSSPVKLDKIDPYPDMTVKVGSSSFKKRPRKPDYSATMVIWPQLLKK